MEPTQHTLDSPPPLPFERHAFEFTGSGGEYFRIWIVNLLLSVVTLGVYSAWAKVRRREYFYRHTRLAGASFDYHGKPLAILKGRIIALVLFGGYYVATLIDPMLGVAAFAVLAAVLPWLINRSLQFRLYNSSYRGLRFHFHGTTRAAYWVFLALPLLSALSLFTLTPFWHHRLKCYQHGNAAFGRTRFAFAAPVSAFYGAYLKVALVAVGVIVVFVALVGGTAAAGALGGNPPSSSQVVLLTVAAVVLYLVGVTVIWAMTTALIQNVVWRHTALGSFQFSSALSPRHMCFLVFTNVLGIACTLGLYKPFADIRMTRYVLGAMQIAGVGALDTFAAAERGSVSAVGEEAMELLDIDLAF
jgi:uncharacterized membrane protein YjgN (DUF898 family)